PQHRPRWAGRRLRLPRTPALLTYPGGRSSECLLWAVTGLLLGESLEDQLVDQPLLREAAVVEVVLVALDGLLHPVHVEVVDCLIGGLLGVALELQLLDQAGPGERGIVEVVTGALDRVLLLAGELGLS